jgi:hypothetical protein
VCAPPRSAPLPSALPRMHTSAPACLLAPRHRADVPVRAPRRPVRGCRHPRRARRAGQEEAAQRLKRGPPRPRARARTRPVFEYRILILSCTGCVSVLHCAAARSTRLGVHITADCAVQRSSHHCARHLKSIARSVRTLACTRSPDDPAWRTSTVGSKSQPASSLCAQRQLRQPQPPSARKRSRTQSSGRQPGPTRCSRRGLRIRVRSESPQRARPAHALVVTNSSLSERCDSFRTAASLRRKVCTAPRSLRERAVTERKRTSGCGSSDHAVMTRPRCVRVAPCHAEVVAGDSTPVVARAHVGLHREDRFVEAWQVTGYSSPCVRPPR